MQGQLHTLKLKSGEQIESFLRRVAELRASLLELGEEVEDMLLVPIVLRALLEKYHTFATTLNILKQTSDFEELVNMLQQEEASHVDFHEEEQAMVSNQRGKKPF